MITRALIRRVRSIEADGIPSEALFVAKHCLLDWLGVTLAGSREPLSGILADVAAEQGGSHEATLIGRGDRTSTLWAALVNGAASHALDYDDTHLQMTGHPSVPVLPGLLALAEARGASGRAFLAAFVAGVETECRLGAVLGLGHYAAGWHSTATMGTFGAAAACAHLLGLDEDSWAHAFGLAGAQASGLKSAFGTMTKPFHAGKASYGGLLAAILASRGFTSDSDVLEAFASTHAGSLDPGGLGPGGLDPDLLIRDTVFKYHAACYLTHASIEGVFRLREEHELDPNEVERVDLHVPPGHLSVCNIEEPATGLEGKFSLRATAAMALLGDRTADPAAFTDSRMHDAEIVRLRDRVSVIPSDGLGPAESRVAIHVRGGRKIETTVDTGRPASDLDGQWVRLTEKFVGLSSPILGEDTAWRLHGLVDKAEGLEDVSQLAAACRPGGSGGKRAKRADPLSG